MHNEFFRMAMAHDRRSGRDHQSRAHLSVSRFCHTRPHCEEWLSPVIPLILVAASVSSLNFLCLYFGNCLVAWLELNYFQPRGWVRFALVLIFANALFVVVFAGLMSIVSGDIYNHGILSTLVAATNVMSILFVAAFSGMSRLVGRLR